MAQGITVKGTSLEGLNIPLLVVESVDFPGLYGLVVLNPDGTMLSAGTPAVASTYDVGAYDTAVYA